MVALATEDQLELAVMTRLAALAGNIEGVQRTIVNAPAEVIPVHDLPCVYTLTRGTLTPSVVAAGQLTVIRNYVQRLLLIPATGGLNDVSLGSEANQLALPFLGRWELFFAARLNLQDVALAPLRGCTLFDMLDTGAIVVPAPGGEMHVAVDFTLSIEMTFAVKQIAPPYPE